MSKAVFTTKINPAYDDLPEERYHFPRRYLRVVEMALNDWVIYYESRRPNDDLSSRGGRQAYFATARVDKIIPDPTKPDHFYAFMRDYLEFDRPTPFKEGAHYYESALRKADGSTNKGAFGRAVRSLCDAEYDLILRAGFGHVLGERKRIRPFGDAPEEPLYPVPGLAEEHAPALECEPRRVVQQIVERPFRDKAFSAAVKSAYRDACAITGIKIINGGGRSEVQAAHIQPVAAEGPDSLRNGLALSGTVHWMFDRGLISVDDDYSILIAKDKVPDIVRGLFNPEGRLLLPLRPEERPHRQFLHYHRSHVFKG